MWFAMCTCASLDFFKLRGAGWKERCAITRANLTATSTSKATATSKAKPPEDHGRRRQIAGRPHSEGYPAQLSVVEAFPRGPEHPELWVGAGQG